MTLPIQFARELLGSLADPSIRSLVAQAKAKQVLREVREDPENFPQFTPELDTRVTFIAYSTLAAGCSMIEAGSRAEGYVELQVAADMLESVHRTETLVSRSSAFHSLIGAMAFHACGQYSRAFVLVRDVESVTPVAGIIASFLRRDTTELVSRLGTVLLAETPEDDDSLAFNDWVTTVALARAIAMLLEHTVTGEPALLDKVESLLQDAMTISENAWHPSFWWMARLLRLGLDDYRTGSLWNALPPFFSSTNNLRIDDYVKLLALSTPPVTELWPSQLTSLELALGQGYPGGVINLRTSAGKTRVAEMAILQTFQQYPDAKVLYLAPFRSLAFELERTFSETMVPLGYLISHLYGGSRFSGVDRELVDEAQLIIATPEKAKAMLRAAPDLFDPVKLIVVDEGHLLGPTERNVRNELFLEHLRLLGRQRGIRVLLLSAVLPNATDLALWLGGSASALARSNWKPSAERFGLLRWSQNRVEIEWLGEERCFNRNFVQFEQVYEKGKRRRFPKTKQEAVAAAAVRLMELGPVLIFAGQAQWVSSMAKNVLLALGPNPPPHNWPENEWKIFEAVCHEELGQSAVELQAARVGVICHSNKLPPQVRIAVEKLMAKRSPRIVVATTTLGQGVNIGISSVIVSSTFIGAKNEISKRDFWNICGRAGRAFVDSEGKVLFAIDATRLPWQIRQDEAKARHYLDIQELDTVQSGLLRVVQALRSISNKAGVSFEILLELVANNDFERLSDNKRRVERDLDWIDDQILALHVEYEGFEDVTDVGWVDEAFRESLAAIQERLSLPSGEESELLTFMRARARGVLNAVPSAQARRAVVASGLPLSVGTAAFDDLDEFRNIVDVYLSNPTADEGLPNLITAFENWCRENAQPITKELPTQELLDAIRPLWLSGIPLIRIVNAFGQSCREVCTELYGYQLPWLINAIVQKFDRVLDADRIEALALAALLVELGLPNESSAKVFLAGVRSRSAAVELGQFVSNPSASVRRIQNALLEPSTLEWLNDAVSQSTREWLALLSSEHRSVDYKPPRCAPFRLEAPVDVDVIHVRRPNEEESVYLCSIDGTFKFDVESTKDMPFSKMANDLRFAFSRDGDVWTQHSRDPRVQI